MIMNTRQYITPEKRKIIYEKFNGHCAYCGKEIEYKDMQVDHLIPLRVGGDNDIKNLMPSCRLCNHYKRANSLEGWRKMIEEIPFKLKRNSYIYKVGLQFGNVITNYKRIEFYFEEVERLKRGE